MVAAMTIVFSKQLTDKEREKLFSGDEDSPGDPPGDSSEDSAGGSAGDSAGDSTGDSAEDSAGDSSEKVSSCLTALCSFCIVSFPMCQKS